MKFFTFHQNNSGGSFVFDKSAGISEYVIVQAPNALTANGIALGIGLYFDGSGDCNCCGSRWSEQWSDDAGTDIPTIYGNPISMFGWDEENNCPSSFAYRWMGEREFVFVHMLSGAHVGFHYPAHMLPNWSPPVREIES